MLLGSNIDSAIPQLVNEVKGAASVAAWAVSNELSADNRCKPISNCLDKLTQAVNMVANLDPGRPVMVVTVFDGGFQSAKAVRNALAKGMYIAVRQDAELLTSRSFGGSSGRVDRC